MINFDKKLLVSIASWSQNSKDINSLLQYQYTMTVMKNKQLEDRVISAMDTPHRGLFFLALGITFASLIYQEVLKNKIE